MASSIFGGLEVSSVASLRSLVNAASFRAILASDTIAIDRHRFVEQAGSLLHVLAARPATMKTVRIGLIGSQFVTTIHLEALRTVPGTEIVAVTSATEAHAKEFAARHGLPRWFTD